MADMTLEGGCLCGSVRYRVTGDPVFQAVCHCGMCRRASAAPAVGWVMYPDAQFQVLSGELKAYESSPGCRRTFCPQCGTQLTFIADDMPGLVDITIGSLDEPGNITPTLHYWESSRVPWLKLDDGLPRYPQDPPQPP